MDTQTKRSTRVNTENYFEWTALAEAPSRNGDGPQRQPQREPPGASAVELSDPSEPGKITPLTQWLEASKDIVIGDAEQILKRCHLKHYEYPDSDVNRVRLSILFSLVMKCLRCRRVEPIQAYAQALAGERFRQGCNIGEVQTAMNALEEAIWKQILRQSESTDLAYSLGLVTTVLGTAKDVLARTYVSLASDMAAPTMNLRAVFDGPGCDGLDEECFDSTTNDRDIDASQLNGAGAETRQRY